MGKLLKVLMITTSINYPLRGGLSRHTYELCKALNKFGCQVYVTCMDEPENTAISVSNKILVPCFSAPFLDLISFNINTLRKTWGYDIDVVHSQAGHGFIFAVAKKRPLVVTVHGTSIRVLRAVSELQHHVLPYFTVLTEKYTLMRADKIIAVSKSVANNIQIDYGVKGDKIVYIPNGVDVEKFNPNLDGESIRSKYDVNGPLLLCVTRLRSDRFVQELIPMVRDVIKEIPDAKLIIVGDGPLRPYLERLRNQHGLAENVILTGAKGNDLPYFYTAADLCVLPGLYPPAMKEMTVLEALACGKIVVYIKRIRSDTKEDQIFGDSVIATNSKNFTSTIVYLLQNERKRKELGFRARMTIVKNFSWDKIAEKTIDAYKSLI